MTTSTPSTLQKQGFVLYVDHQGHPAPLTEHFHATASRRLSSAVYRYPLATVTEVDSAYCPQCLTFHDAVKAATLGFCNKATCQRCPLCLSVASVHTNSANGQSNKLECYYQCGMCDWTSKLCGLSTPVPSPNDDGSTGIPGRVELLRAAEDLASAVTERRQSVAQPVSDLHRQLSDEWEQYRTAKRERASTSERHADYWSVETLETKLQSTAANLAADQSDYDLLSSVFKRVSIQEILGTEEAKIKEEEADDDPRSLLSYQMQSNTLDSSELLPLPIPLTTRRSRRCRAEQNDGRPGILLKPKLNPLEGDSSLPTGHGQWHRKDSCAIHVIPRVQVVQQYHHPPDAEKDPTKHIFLIHVANPTLGTVRFRITKSTYRGEVDHWNEMMSTEELEETKKTKTAMAGVLVDTLQQTILDLVLNLDLTKSLTATDTVELKSAEDSIIELGAQSRETPVAVLEWDPARAATSSAVSAIRLVAQSASDAWFELVLRQPQESNSGPFNAVPLAMEVDLGGGSWESSLIPVEENEGNDKVTLDIVLAWT